MQSRESGEGGGDVEGPDPVPYHLHAMTHSYEDIIFCIDIDRQVEAEMKVAGAKGQLLTRIDSIKQALLLFVHSKLNINPNHRFAFATMGHTANWCLKEFTNDIDSISATVRGLAADALYIHSDLSQLFRMAVKLLILKFEDVGIA